jgi:2-keto-4-pentenoate hydratase/2-oxohepta-3-ene-1,7-dioic acid hydratase in catechol pathway
MFVKWQDESIVPSKVVCIGRNYVDHIHELNNEVPDNMVVFNKPCSAISQELLSFHEEQLHYEGELCFLVQSGKFVAVGFGIDLTKRSMQSTLKAKGLPWERAKAFDGSAVFSEFVSIDHLDKEISLTLSINERVIQSGGTSLMIYKPHQILKEVSSFMTLVDGDVVMTGTPKGVGKINSGDTFEGSISIDNQVVCSHRWIAK